ncbi:MAG: hypothetical protein IT537_03140 [Hyphomicrobiales bacterium]|nr:hypothetical protein [Hyphomicrobiales bacterium]
MVETSDPLVFVMVAVGAVLTIGSAAISGLKIECWARRYCAWVPADIGAPIGALIGVVVVARWFT